MLSNVTYVTLFVADQERALEFYVDRLGFEKRVDNRNVPGAGRFLTVGLRGQDLQLVLWPGSPGQAKQSAGPVPGICTIESTDCIRDFDRLKALGVAFETPEVIKQPWGKMAIAQDPDGNRIALREQARPTG
jgi:catechol 2,3-dioxygenase-like lactoylglutathione lyase family enzyme